MPSLPDDPDAPADPDDHAPVLDVPADLHYPEIPAEPETLAGLRRILAGWATRVGMASDRVQDLTLAAYEAMVNVVVHAYRDRPGVFELHATYLAELRQVTITVIDHGHWRAPGTDGAALRLGGRGLPLIRALASDATITAGSGGTCVRMLWQT